MIRMKAPSAGFIFNKRRRSALQKYSYFHHVSYSSAVESINFVCLHCRTTDELIWYDEKICYDPMEAGLKVQVRPESLNFLNRTASHTEWTEIAMNARQKKRNTEVPMKYIGVADRSGCKMCRERNWTVLATLEPTAV